MKKCTLVLAAIALLVATGNNHVNAQHITVTIAGTGVVGNAGDAGNSRQALLSGPKDVCMDAAQNIYFTEKANGIIRKVASLNGVISTIAGGGTSTLDGVPATTAMITPNYMCISSGGNIYITTSNMVRKINGTTGIITTVAGSATPGYTGDGAAAALATLNNPQGICIDAAGNLYIVDRGNNAIRKITASTGNITTIAGNGTAGSSGDGGPAISALLNKPVVVCVNPAGDVFFSDQNPTYPGYDNSIIRKISATTGIVTHTAGSNITMGTIYDCPATAATLGTITGMCIAESGDLYCDEMSCSCRRLSFITDTLYEVAGNFYTQAFTDDIQSALGDMNIPYGLCVDHAGSVYIADSNNQRIRKVIPLTHTPTFAFGNGQYIEPTVGIAYPLDSMMWAADIDSGEAETWSIVTAPLHGTLAGFPASSPSNGVYRTTKPTGLSYTAATSYAGGDVFRARVSDGTHSDTIIIYVGPNGTAMGGTLGTTTIAKTTSLDIFPNPASSTLNIQWAGLRINTANVVINDVTDRIVYRNTFSSNNGTSSSQIDISSLPSGTYFIMLNGAEVRKFVKE